MFWSNLMGLSEQIRQQLISSFKTEQAEHIQKISQGLLTLEKNPDEVTRQAVLKEVFREAHSLKGAARAVGMTVIESLGHALEDILANVKEARLTFSPELFDLLYQTLDAVELMMGQLEAGNSTPPTNVLTLLSRLEAARKATVAVKASNHKASQPQAGESTPEAPVEVQPSPQAGTGPPADFTPKSQVTGEPLPAVQSDETIRVSVSKLDALMAQFSELVGAKIRAEQRLAEVGQLQHFAAEWQKEWVSLRNRYGRLLRNHHGNGHKDVAALVDFVSHNQEELRTFNTRANTLYRQLSNDTLRLSLAIDELQEEIKRVRMLPLSTITAAFGRMVRDLAREQGKQISLVILGGETELDKRVLEYIKDPLIHLLRNATDHGLESPEERRQANKPAEGRIWLQASQQGNNVVITVKDDGRGLNLEAIRLSAVRKGLMSLAEAQKLSDGDAANLIFNSGLSTGKIITDISGRGVGLDVVRQNVEELHGAIQVQFEPGQGTTFTLTLPLTLVSSRGLLVKVSDQIFILPLTTVERMLHVQRHEIASVEGREAISYQGKPVVLAWLADLLELPHPTKESGMLTIVIISVAEKRLGLIVDELVGEQEIVIKSLGKQLAKVGGIAGATVLGSGRVVLVLHTADLVKLAAKTRSRDVTRIETNHKELVERKTILVVDDSITTRTLEKNVLEAAGYEVKLATNGEEALALLLTDKLPNLIISDINMPRLDGFGLTSRIKQDGRYRNIPVILVTSLDSPADKARGIEVGADAYIVKSQFDQGNLLETIEQLT
jgi:two-component system chemotaxis sensor kinase CheA